MEGGVVTPLFLGYSTLAWVSFSVFYAKSLYFIVILSFVFPDREL